MAGVIPKISAPAVGRRDTAFGNQVVYDMESFLRENQVLPRDTSPRRHALLRKGLIALLGATAVAFTYQRAEDLINEVRQEIPPPGYHRVSAYAFMQ